VVDLPVIVVCEALQGVQQVSGQIIDVGGSPADRTTNMLLTAPDSLAGAAIAPTGPSDAAGSVNASCCSSLVINSQFRHSCTSCDGLAARRCSFLPGWRLIVGFERFRWPSRTSRYEEEVGRREQFPGTTCNLP
jgi:hypothetical protein